MINWMVFPQNRRIEPHLMEDVKAFRLKQEAIDKETHLELDNLKSDAVLELVADDLERIGYRVERSKKKHDKIRIPLLYEQQGIVNLAFQ